MKKFQLVFSFFLLFFALGIQAKSQEECFPKKPSQESLVNDFADILTPAEEQSLEQKLVGFNDTTSTQIAIVTVNSLCGYDHAGFTYKIGEDWGVGDARFDNGIVVMVKPKIGNEKGQTFIATGYGLEGVLPDAIAKRIVENEMIPYFQIGNMYGGINAAAETIMQITGGEYSAEAYQEKTQGSFPFIPLLVIFGALFFIFFANFKRVKKYSKNNNLGFWAALALMSAANNRHSGSFGNFRSGGGGFGGGGFGGFGGGSFGGGGAGGSW